MIKLILIPPFPGSNPGAPARFNGSVPDTWVTVYSGDMGNTLGRMLSLPAAAKPLARYGAMGARFASGFAVWRMVEPGSGCRTLGPNGLSRGSSLQVSWSKYPRS